MPETPQGPDWDRLYEAAAAQEGYFTTKQAAEAGYSSQLLQKYLHTGKVLRVGRGVYRLVHFPAGDHEELVSAWLWSEQAGVVSHQSALALHGLSDVLPATIHLTLPISWKRRRLRIPGGIELHHGDVPPNERTWFGSVPATSAARTLNDCAQSELSPELLQQAARQALRRGLASRNALGEVKRALEKFGGIPK